MRNEDYTEFCELLDGAYDPIGSGANKIISGSAKGLFFAAMGAYSLETVRAALSAHCLDKVRGRFTPKPADIIEQIEGAAANDGRPGAEEAWAIALTGRDESDTVVWTEEIAEAFALCLPVLDVGDDVGARMAFKEAYGRIVSGARSGRHPVKWSASLGWDIAKREAVIKKASTSGLLSAPVAAALLPPPADVVIDDENAKSQINKIRQMMEEMNDKRSSEASAAFEAERMATVDAKRKAQELTENYQASRM